MTIEWTDGFTVSVSLTDGAAVVSANREGLLSLAKIFAALAEEAPGCHVHLDRYNALGDGSAELIVEKTEDERKEQGQ